MNFFNLKLLDVDPQDMGEEDGSVVDLDAQRKGKCAVIKTSTRQVIIKNYSSNLFSNYNIVDIFLACDWTGRC